MMKKLTILDSIKPKYPYVYTKYIAEDSAGKLYQTYDIMSNRFLSGQEVYTSDYKLVRWFYDLYNWSKYEYEPEMDN